MTKPTPISRQTFCLRNYHVVDQLKFIFDDAQRIKLAFIICLFWVKQISPTSLILRNFYNIINNAEVSHYNSFGRNASHLKIWRTFSKMSRGRLKCSYRVFIVSKKKPIKLKSSKINCFNLLFFRFFYWSYWYLFLFLIEDSYSSKIIFFSYNQL